MNDYDPLAHKIAWMLAKALGLTKAQRNTVYAILRELNLQEKST